MQKIQLSIPEPCHENWQQMTPTNQGRFCDSCAKEVVDFSMMTDTEVLNYFSTVTHEKVCGRALPNQLNRNISWPKEPKKRLFWYWNYIVMFFMFFAKTNNVKAQGDTTITTTINPVKKNDIRGEIAATTLPLVAGDRVIASNSTNADENLQLRSAAMPQTGNEVKVRLGGVRVLKEGNDPLYVVDGTIISTGKVVNPDDVDDYSVLQAPAAMALFGPEGANGAIVITTRKAKAKSLDTVTVFANEIITGRLVRKVCSTTVMGAAIAGVNVKNTISDSLKMLATKFTGAMKIYPNPVQAGRTFNIDLKLKQTGHHQIMITDATGRIVFQKQINAVTRACTEKILADNRWSSGVYYISLFNNKNQMINKTGFIFQ